MRCGREKSRLAAATSGGGFRSPPAKPMSSGFVAEHRRLCRSEKHEVFGCPHRWLWCRQSGDSVRQCGVDVVCIMNRRTVRSGNDKSASIGGIERPAETVGPLLRTHELKRVLAAENELPCLHYRRTEKPSKWLNAGRSSIIFGGVCTPKTVCVTR